MVAVESDATMRTVTAVIVESGATYSLFLILLLALYVSKNFASYILMDAVRHRSFRNFSAQLTLSATGNTGHCEHVSSAQ